MKLEELAAFDLGVEAGFLHSSTVQLKGRQGILFVYSAGPAVDPGEECFRIQGIQPVHVALFEMNGRRIWDKQLPDGVLPGIWFVPVLPFDMNRDGEDEIYVLNNTGAPFSFMHRKLERWDAETGTKTGSWPWPFNTFEERMSLSYRFYLVGGYAHGEPVLVTCQGTYANMYLQGWRDNHVPRWELVIRKEEPGPRASHVTPVLDINGDGVDELFWGERMLSMEDGHEIIDLAPNYQGHSDVVIPYQNYKTGEWYVFTCREGDERPGRKRVFTFRLNADIAWEQVDYGHMHTAWAANVLEDYGKIVMVMRQRFVPDEYGLEHALDGVFYFDAYTGEPVDFHMPCAGTEMYPVDLDGDGYHEFYVFTGALKGAILDRKGRIIARLPDEPERYAEGTVRMGRLLPHAGEQLMIAERDGTCVYIYGDAEACDGPIMQKRYAMPYLTFMQKLMSSGYNCVGSQGSCGV